MVVDFQPAGKRHWPGNTILGPILGLRWEIEVKLGGGDGTAFAILGTVRRAMQRGGLAKEPIDEYTNEATAGDYDHLLAATLRYVEVV